MSNPKVNPGNERARECFRIDDCIGRRSFMFMVELLVWFMYKLLRTSVFLLIIYLCHFTRCSWLFCISCDLRTFTDFKSPRSDHCGQLSICFFVLFRFGSAEQPPCLMFYFFFARVCCCWLLPFLFFLPGLLVVYHFAHSLNHISNSSRWQWLYVYTSRPIVTDRSPQQGSHQPARNASSAMTSHPPPLSQTPASCCNRHRQLSVPRLPTCPISHWLYTPSY